jgi:hypothetical protein
MQTSGYIWRQRRAGLPIKDRGHRQRPDPGIRVGRFESALLLSIIFLIAVPVAEESPSLSALSARRAQKMIDELRLALAIDREVQVAIAVNHPLVFAVEPADPRKERFVLTMELGFLIGLDDDELRAALAHELGHIWIFTHHPFLQTERLANSIGQRVVSRPSFEKLYSKLWKYEGTPGVPIEQLLGPSQEVAPIAEPDR